MSPLLLTISLVCFSLPALFFIGFIGYNLLSGTLQGISPWYLYPIYFLMIVIFSIFLYALVPSYHLVTRIKNNQFITEESLSLLHKIMMSAFVITILFIIEWPFWYLVAENDDAPGLILLILYVTSLSFTVSVFALALKRVIRNQLN